MEEYVNGRQYEGTGDRAVVSVLIPCYASERYLGDTVARIKKVFAEAEEKYGYQIILVNDCSPDGTYGVIERLCAEDLNIVGVNLPENVGQDRAIIAGYEYVKGDYLICMDDDGQHPPEEIFSLIRKLDEGCDLVYAQYPKLEESLPRRIASKLTNLMLTALASKPRGISATSFIAMNSTSIGIIQSLTEYYTPLCRTLAPYSVKIGAVTVCHRKRTQGRSNYTLKKLFQMWADMVFGRKISRP